MDLVLSYSTRLLKKVNLGDFKVFQLQTRPNLNIKVQKKKRKKERKKKRMLLVPWDLAFGAAS